MSSKVCRNQPKAWCGGLIPRIRYRSPKPGQLGAVVPVQELSDESWVSQELFDDGEVDKCLGHSVYRADREPSDNLAGLQTVIRRAQ